MNHWSAVFNGRLKTYLDFFCRTNRLEFLESPAFVSSAVTFTKWTLKVFPHGSNESNRGFLGVYLKRENLCVGPNLVEIRFLFSIVGTNGTNLIQTAVGTRTFSKGDCFGFGKFLTVERICQEGLTFIPEDILCVQCALYTRSLNPVSSRVLYARTIPRMYRRGFVWRINQFSNLQAGNELKLHVGILCLKLQLIERVDSLKEIKIEIGLTSTNMIYLVFKTATLNSENKKDCYSQKIYWGNDIMKNSLDYSLIFPAVFMERNTYYLPNDTLTLECEYLYYTTSHYFEFQMDELSVANASVVPKENQLNQNETSFATDMHQDFKCLYNHGSCSDFKISTNTQTFLVHKAILIARSPVFLKMLTSDMLEKERGYVEITDTDDETLNKLLLYMYTDSLKLLDFESACKLFSVADKYEILSLQHSCSAFLKQNLNTTNVCDVIYLAYLHEDQDLKLTAEKYVLDHEDVISSLEWKLFMKNHLNLAAEVMHKKILNIEIHKTNEDNSKSLLSKLSSYVFGRS